MSYCTYEDVLNLTRVKPKQFGYKDEDSEEEFKSLVEGWIKQSESHINAYCKQNWYPYYTDSGEEVHPKLPDAVKNVCIRLTANMIAFSFGRRDNPMKKVDDWTTGVISSEVFTEDLRQDLKPFCKARKAHIFKI